MKRPLTYTYYLLQGRRRIKMQNTIDAVPMMERMNHHFAGHDIEDTQTVQREIAADIAAGRPIMVARLGANELANMRTTEFDDKRIKDKNLDLLCTGAGFFPHDASLLPRFYDEMIYGCRQTDYLAAWFQPFEDYYIKTAFKKDLHVTYLHYIDPFREEQHPWTEALAGKRVLVIHPLADIIKDQYENRRGQIFPGTNILPGFTLIVQKAVQTSAGETDARYKDWFAALDAMYEEAMKVDFDVAILGCGAYGFPLAARIKAVGKSAIHMGGTTQILFGIHGKRWDEDVNHQFLNKYYSDAWVRLTEKDRPKNAEAVENACYW